MKYSSRFIVPESTNQMSTERRMRWKVRPRTGNEEHRTVESEPEEGQIGRSQTSGIDSQNITKRS